MYYVCCRDGDYRPCTKPRQTGRKRPNQKDTRKINNTCISRIYVDFYKDGHVTATHVTGHTNHQPGPHEDMYLPLPKSIREEIAIKLSSGIPAERIMEGNQNLVLYAETKTSGSGVLSTTYRITGNSHGRKHLQFENWKLVSEKILTNGKSFNVFMRKLKHLL